jgi:hypothetical protein
MGARPAVGSLELPAGKGSVTIFASLTDQDGSKAPTASR